MTLVETEGMIAMALRETPQAPPKNYLLFLYIDTFSHTERAGIPQVPVLFHFIRNYSSRMSDTTFMGSRNSRILGTT